MQKKTQEVYYVMCSRPTLNNQLELTSLPYSKMGSCRKMLMLVYIVLKF